MHIMSTTASSDPSRVHRRLPIDELPVNQIPEEPDPQQTAYNPFRETEQYRAFREGWYAQQRQQPPAHVPYPLSRPQLALAWLDGWTAAKQDAPEQKTAGTER